MTIALALKVNDGVILAADSASTLISIDPDTGQGGVASVYNNANKIANLLKGSPIGMLTWGAGSIGIESTATLAKDLRQRFAGNSPSHMDWHVDPANYAMTDIAGRFRTSFLTRSGGRSWKVCLRAHPNPPYPTASLRAAQRCRREE